MPQNARNRLTRGKKDVFIEKCTAKVNQSLQESMQGIPVIALDLRGCIAKVCSVGGRRRVMEEGYGHMQCSCIVNVFLVTKEYFLTVIDSSISAQLLL